jgi:Peptidase family M28
MAFLADDALEGRGTGTRGFDAAARYVASQFEGLGLRPVAGSYRQEMTIRRARVVEHDTSLTILRGGMRETLAYGSDFVSYGETSASNVDLSGDVVFVGDGITVAGRGIDAYRNVSARGKIVVAVPESPDGLSESEGAFFGDARTKAANAADHGAVALLLVEEAHIPWELRVRAARQLGSSEWLPHHEDARLKAVVYISRAAAERILGQRLDQTLPRSGVGLGSAALKLTTELTDLRSANVWSVLTGSRPRLAAEYVVLTAHLDHLGIGASSGGDAIYNGAVDNASGVAGLLAIAQAFAALPAKPARSILFIATTGEESGEIGSDYFVRHPPVPLAGIVASFNIDGLSVTPFEEAVAAGGANSTLGAVAEAAGREVGIRVKNESIGIGGSDHSPFLESAIPVLWIQAALSDDWMSTRYHTVRDDMSQTLDFEAAARYTKLVFAATYMTAAGAKRPAWNRGEFFAVARGR